jgi:hypothetical protein
MPTLMQKIKLAIRGWNRRREESAREFVAQSTSWAPPAHTGRSLTPGVTAEIDMEGLVCAFLDDSGRIAYYLDTESGDVVDVRDSRALAPPRYRRVPARSAESDAADQRAFIAAHPQLANAANFREVLSRDRALERAWYNFKNDRAIAAINAWLVQK